jgi:ribonuclease HI
MSNPRPPHFLLFAEAQADGDQGSWQFSLSQVGGSDSLTASSAEPIACRERLELLAVVRGLEALDQPARVTLVTNSRYVNRGLKHGLAEWRAADWRWERFGQLVSVRDGDLWRRVDRALTFHELDCRLWRFDAAEMPEAAPATSIPATTAPSTLADPNDYPVRNLRRRASRPAAWREPLEPAELAAG